MKKITHSYEGLGSEYLKARSGSPKFAEFIVSHAGFDENEISCPLTIVELGVGSGQQTEFIEKELHNKGITRYKILAYDKSPDQLDTLKTRMGAGEITKRVIPVHFDFDVAGLPLNNASVDIIYMAHVFHHVADKENLLREIVRVLRDGCMLFILGITLEDLKNHPLDEFFPTKYEYEVDRYPTVTRYRQLFESSGLTYEKPFRTGRHNIRPIDREFLASVENTIIDSALKLMQEKDPAAFTEGVTRVRKAVELAEKSGSYRLYQSADRLRVFWGLKK